MSEKQPEEKNEDVSCEKCEEYKQGWQRAQADYQNLVRETNERKTELVRMSEWQIIEEFLPVYDNFKKAFAAEPGEINDACRNWMKGIEYIMKQFGDVLVAHNVEPIKTVGEAFNPALHDALAEEDGDGEPGIIIKEVDAGYTMNGKVLKVAKVTIIKDKS